jgi:hypothetical protein
MSTLLIYPLNALLIYPQFPDSCRSFKHAPKFLGKRAVELALGLAARIQN